MVHKILIYYILLFKAVK